MKKEKIIQITEALEEVNQAMKNLNMALSSGPASFYYDKLIGYYEGCMAAAKYQVGDRVVLAHDLDLTNAPGWQPSAHFLIKDSPATVKGIDYRKGKYVYDVMFDYESWINDKKQKVMIEDRHTFCMHEEDLKGM
jgi:hypothetical protein